METRQPVLGILVGPKGRGSNMAAIIRSGVGKVAVVVSPSPGSPALAVADELGVNTAVVPYGETQADELLQTFAGCDLICLAGYLRLFPSKVLTAFPNRVLNIHPALLPKFGGKGMFGHHVHEAVLATGETESGCSVHFVTDQFDEGQVIVQKRCPVLPGDTATDLADRVLKLEHASYPEAIQIAWDQILTGSEPSRERLT